MRQRINLGRSKNRPVTPIEEPKLKKDFSQLELQVKRAFLDCNTAAEGTGMVMNIFKTNLSGYLDNLLDGPKQTLINRILTLKSQVNEK